MSFFLLEEKKCMCECAYFSEIRCYSKIRLALYSYLPHKSKGNMLPLAIVSIRISTVRSAREPIVLTLYGVSKQDLINSLPPERGDIGINPSKLIWKTSILISICQQDRLANLVDKIIDPDGQSGQSPCNKVEPFAALLWAFGIVLANT